MTLNDDTWQLVLVDVLFLCLAGSIGFWFRGWWKKEQKAFKERLMALEEQQVGLEHLCNRLNQICHLFEPLARREGETSVSSKQPTDDYAAGRPPLSMDEQQKTMSSKAYREERYERARELLAQGQQPGEIARKLGLGRAEVELMGRIQRHKKKD